MPTFEQHIGKAHHNEEFVARIKSDPNFLDWAVTGYFYAAVHYIESYFAKFLGRHSTDHGERLTTVCTSSARMRHFGFQVKRQSKPMLIGLV